MAEQAKAETPAAESAENADNTEIEENKTIYDSVFHTIVQNLPQLLIALINLTFDKNYPKDTEIVHLRNIHHHKSGVITTDCFLLIGEITYHIECQTQPDGTMALRMVEYDFMIAFEQAWRNQSDTIKMPSSCVVCLRHTKNTPDVYRVTILGQDGQTMEYRCPVIKVQNYSLDELFEKNLLMLLPYYIMRYEKRFPAMEADEALRSQFLDEVVVLSDRLESAVKPGDRAGVYQDLMQLITDIAKYELRACQKTLEGVKKIMEARILPLPSDALRNERKMGREEGRKEGRREGRREGREEGRKEGRQEGREEGREVGREEGAATMFNSMIRTMYEKGCPVLQIANFTNHSEETVRNSLQSQGLILQ